jgi:hypothetical protein
VDLASLLFEKDITSFCLEPEELAKIEGLCDLDGADREPAFHLLRFFQARTSGIDDLLEENAVVEGLLERDSDDVLRASAWLLIGAMEGASSDGEEEEEPEVQMFTYDISLLPLHT